MNTESKENDNGNSTENQAALPHWADCDFFCIHDYAATGASPCGWRGRRRDARHDEALNQLLCPRCGCATLLRIPLADASNEQA